MRFTHTQITQIQIALGKLKSLTNDCSTVTDEFKAKVETFVARFWDAKESQQIEWVDQLGAIGQRNVGAMGLIKVIEATTDALGYIENSSFWDNDSFESSLEFALLMRENVEGIGAGRAMLFKAMFDGCTREEATTIHVMETVFYAGKHAWGGAPWESSEGHTIWTPQQVLQTIINCYSYTIEQAKDLSKFLLKTGLIQNYGGLISLPSVRKTENKILKYVNEDSTAFVLEPNSYNLTDDQKALLEALCETDKRVVTIKGAGGTGKTFTIAKYISACMKIGKRVLACAPTGISAKVLNDSLQASGISTTNLECGGVVVLDRALALAKFGNLAASVLIIDEASMVSINHMAIVGSIGDVQRLVMLGDPTQLRPVDVGQPFKDLIKHEKSLVLELYKNMRADSEKLSQELDKVRNGKGIIHKILPMAKSPYARDHADIKADPRIVPKEQRDQLGRWIRSSVESGYVWLAHTNNLVKSLSNYNLAVKLGFVEDSLDLYLLDIIAAYFGAKGHRYQPTVSMDIAGLEVYWTADRHGDDIRVYRGFLGTVNNGYVTMNAVTKEGVPSRCEFPLDEVDNKIMPWMAKTVHKSQGQSLENVIYLIKTTMGAKHNLELAYTAQSRAKKDAMVISLCNESKAPSLIGESDRETYMGLNK